MTFVMTPRHELALKIGVTMAYSRRYGMSIEDVTDMFVEHDVYGYIRDNSELFITRPYDFTAGFINKVLFSDSQC
jgi:hypothetical protein